MGRPKIKTPKDELRDLYLGKKLSVDQIAKRFYCSERTVFVRLYEYNIPIKHDNRRIDITKDKLEELYISKKLSIGKIAKIFRCGKNTIWVRLCQHNIRPRTKSEANKGKYRVKIPKELKSLYENKKLSTNDIASRFNCSTYTVLRRLHDSNTPIRTLRIDVPKEDLENLYTKEKINIYKIGEIFGCDGITIFNRLKQYNIPIRRKGELAVGKYQVDMPKDKVADLYINKGWPVSRIKGIFSCSPTTIRKRLNKYGIHVRNISEALKGNPSPMKGKHHSEETRKKLSLLTVRQLSSGSMKRKDTSIELKIQEELKRNNIYYQKYIPLCDVTVVDFYLPDYKIAIYADGDYWHNLPVVKIRDEKQNKILKENGYQVLRFWEHEINESIAECISKVKNFIKV